MTRADPVKEYLSERGVSARIAGAGIDGIVDLWRKTVDEIVAGYALGLDDYLNDVDVRQILHELERDLPKTWTSAQRKRLAAADTRCRAHLAPRRSCLWGRKSAEERGWSARTNWWYFSQPRRPGPDLARDLEQSRS